MVPSPRDIIAANNANVALLKSRGLIRRTTIRMPGGVAARRNEELSKRLRYIFNKDLSRIIIVINKLVNVLAFSGISSKLLPNLREGRRAKRGVFVRLSVAKFRITAKVLASSSIRRIYIYKYIYIYNGR
jgi:hypothetical protein